MKFEKGDLANSKIQLINAIVRVTFVYHVICLHPLFVLPVVYILFDKRYVTK